MKNVLLFFLLIPFSILSCQNSLDNTVEEDSLLMTIAKDELFQKYQRCFYERAYHVAMNHFDLDRIGEVLDRHPELENQKDPGNTFDGIEGGTLWWNLTSQYFELREELDGKYGYSGLSEEKRKKIREYYQEFTGKSDFYELYQKVQTSKFD